jgi:transposase
VNRSAADGPPVAFDEFGPLEIRPQTGPTYCRTDKPKRLPATYTRSPGVRHWLAFYDVHQRKLGGCVRPRKRHQERLAVSKLLRRRYPVDQRIHLILEDFSSHRKAEVLRYCQHDNSHLIWTPTNASWLNPIECQFTHVKGFVIRRSDHGNHQELKTALDRYTDYRNRPTQKWNSLIRNGTRTFVSWHGLRTKPSTKHP